MEKPKILGWHITANGEALPLVAVEKDPEVHGSDLVEGATLIDASNLLGWLPGWHWERASMVNDDEPSRHKWPEIPWMTDGFQGDGDGIAWSAWKRLIPCAPLEK